MAGVTMETSVLAFTASFSASCDTARKDTVVIILSGPSRRRRRRLRGAIRDPLRASADTRLRPKAVDGVARAALADQRRAGSSLHEPARARPNLEDGMHAAEIRRDRNRDRAWVRARPLGIGLARTLRFEGDPRQTTALPRFFHSPRVPPLVPLSLLLPPPAAIIYVYYPPLCVSLFPVRFVLRLLSSFLLSSSLPLTSRRHSSRCWFSGLSR